MTNTAVVPHSHAAPVAMQTASLDDPRELGRILAASQYFSDAREAAQAVVKVLAGAEMGFPPIASMTGVYIVKGRVTISSGLMAAAVRRHPRYDYRVKERSNARCVVEFFRDGEPEGTSEFTIEDAKQAQLASGENWRKYPANMLFARAISNGAKTYCPDVFAGAPIYTPDELGAMVDGETGELILEEPKPRRRSTKTPDPAPTPAPEPTPAPTPPPPAAEAPPVAKAAPSQPEPAGMVDIDGTVSTDPGEPEPATAAPTQDPSARLDPEDAKGLRMLLERINAPETFWRGALMSFGASDFSDLTYDQARQIEQRADARAGSWK